MWCPLFNVTGVPLNKLDVHGPFISRELPVALIIMEAVVMCLSELSLVSKNWAQDWRTSWGAKAKQTQVKETEWRISLNSYLPPYVSV